MILNGYAVLDTFLCLSRLVLGATAVGLSVSTLFRIGRAKSIEARTGLEDRFYLLFLLAFVLLIVSLASWPLLYLVLDSYVPQWPSVMCIYGVTQIGFDSLGPPRFLPSLVWIAQGLKPLVAFVAGTWFVLYRLNRSTSTGPLARPLLAVLLVFGLLAMADAGVESTYLIIPKKEEHLSSGCCSVAASADRGHRALSAFSSTNGSPATVAASFYAAHGSTLFALLWAVIAAPRRWRFRLASLLALSVVSWLAGSAFLVEVAAPELLGLPYHHCIYDLLYQVPETIVALVCFVGGSFCVGWACALDFFANDIETRQYARASIARLLRVGFFLNLCSIIMITTELMLAC